MSIKYKIPLVFYGEHEAEHGSLPLADNYESLRKKSFFTFKAPSEETALIQELHTIVGHEICSIIDKEFS